MSMKLLPCCGEIKFQKRREMLIKNIAGVREKSFHKCQGACDAVQQINKTYVECACVCISPQVEFCRCKVAAESVKRRLGGKCAE